MKVVVQRCDDAKVSVDNKVVGKIGKGMMILVGFTDTDTSKEIDYMVNKAINLRIFDDENGVMNKNLLDINGSILSISQFTLYGETGIFGAEMKVTFTNDGPVTIILEK